MLQRRKTPAAMSQWLKLALVGTLAAAAAAPAPAGERGEIIDVRLRNAYGICAGWCPDFEIRVGPDRWVVLRTNPGGPHDEVQRFPISPRQLGEFRRILEPVRPRGHRQLDRACEQAQLPDGTPDPLHDPRPDDVEVRWTGGVAEARLTSCGRTHAATRRVIERAVHVFDRSLFAVPRRAPAGVPAR